MSKVVASGKALKRTGITLIIIGVTIGMVLRFVPDRDWNEALVVFSFLPIFLLVGGAFLFFRGRQYATQAISEAVIYDENPDVLYLRPFKSDPSVAGQAFSALLTPTLLSGMATEEEQLGEVLRPFGDLVAIGQPGESLPKPGAAKLYAPDDEWRKVVTQQMQAARLVVIRAGSGEGVLWELKKATEILDPRKLLLLILGMRRKHYEPFRQQAEDVLGVSLPDHAAMKRRGAANGFFRFSADWTPEFLPLRAPVLRRSPYKPFRRMFQYALKPVFEDFGLEWIEPPVSKAVATAWVILGFLGLLIIAVVFGSIFG